MKKTVVINVVGLSNRHIGEHTPRIAAFQKEGQNRVIKPVLPAVTCTTQSTYLTGKSPQEHGIVANGWYFKDECEVKFWRQSNKLVEASKIWDELKAMDPDFSCANLFWWYNMYSTADYSVTPRPNYLADGRKIPDCYSFPAGLRDELQAQFGDFPLFKFWGPRTSIESSQWIADAAIYTDKKYNPTLSLVYLPHMDYNLQRYGVEDARVHKDLQEIDAVVGQLLDHFEGSRIILLSEYGITPVSRPVHLNRELRKANLLGIRVERGLELLDPGASKAFAVADHQWAHIYLNDEACREQVREILQSTPGVEKIWEGEQRNEVGMNHARSGDFVVMADQDSWFTYYFWEDDRKAPDYARMVDIHKKPGYDPVEMFTDPNDPLVTAKVIKKLIAKKLGFRTVMNVIPLKAELVGGSHGRMPEDEKDFPVFLSNMPEVDTPKQVEATEVYDLIKQHVIKE
ncbi:alkaline phosphatase family protein [Aureicoccus marinus]|uniref:Alkaline phosphatase family protein n=1 Tax=Aureicoccus marinus TaxID=754435 RepID=A0A2S7T7D2_9FLAO|nr:nucleotide pyrophosphatase/phosphodiesterase family protein [Aureicoccus marinus]PQJ15427.1 alkaline phosphatase family protein [Aureicoccus marinus]